METRAERPLKAAGSTDLKFMSCSMVACLVTIIWWMMPEKPVIKEADRAVGRVGAGGSREE